MGYKRDIRGLKWAINNRDFAAFIQLDLRGRNADKDIMIYIITNHTYLGASENGMCPQVAVEIGKMLLINERIFGAPHFQAHPYNNL